MTYVPAKGGAAVLDGGRCVGAGGERGGEGAGEADDAGAESPWLGFIHYFISLQPQVNAKEKWPYLRLNIL